LGTVTVFEIGLSLSRHELVLAKAVRTIICEMPVYSNIIGQRPTASYPNIIQSLADGLSCALPRVPHFGKGEQVSLSIPTKGLCSYPTNIQQVPRTPCHALSPLGLTVLERERERECCLLVLNSVTSTPQWIRGPGPRDLCLYTRPRPGLRDLCLYVNVCSNVLGSCSLEPSVMSPPAL